MTEPRVETEEKAFRVVVAFRSAALVVVPVLLGMLIVPVAVLMKTQAVVFGLIALQITSVLALMLTSMAQVTVGSDGVLVRRLGERRFFAFAEVESVAEIEGEKLRLTLRSGGFYDLYTHKDQNLGKIGYEEKCDKLLARIRAGIARHADDEDRAQRAEAVVDRVREARQPGYRVAEPPSVDDLWSVVGDASASPEARARAAAALRRQAGAGSRAKLLRIAGDTAEPVLAKALRVAAQEDEDEIAEAELEAAIAAVQDRDRAR
ncbi:MAG: hypothetical protein QM820_49815 [Minicystis sp.]